MSNWQISEAIRRFGVAESSTDLIVLRVFKENDALGRDVQSDMQKVVKGQLVPLDDLPTDWTSIKKVRFPGSMRLILDLILLSQYYKLGSDVALAKAGSEEAQRQVVDRIVVNTIAIKSVAV